MGERDARLYGTPEVAARVLKDTTTWFVVGLGNNPDRDAYGIARLLQSRGKRIVPIYPRAEVVHGEQGYATIAEAAAAVGTPDVVDLFVRSSRVGRLVDDAIAAGLDLDGTPIPAPMLALYNEVMELESRRARSGVKKSMRNRIVRTGAKHFDQVTLDERLRLAGWDGLKPKEIAFFYG
jgi:predicted CoA-binding protein